MKMSLIWTVCFILLIVIFPVKSFAQNPSVVVSLPVTPTPTPQTVDYTLPYPGILPDNPLYFLKAIRDNIYGWLISDPLKKTKFDLLMADKRLQMGVFLINEGHDKISLAYQTISKGENYMSQAIDMSSAAKAQNENIAGVTNTLRIATEKHLEVLKGLEKQVPASQRSELGRLESRVTNLIKQAKNIKTN